VIFNRLSAKLTLNMSLGEALVASVALKTEFYDRHERRAYLRAIEVAKRIVDDPRAIANAKQFLERHVRPDARQRQSYETWMELLELEPAAIARAMLENSTHGAELRSSAPVFVVVGGERRTELLR
jgi:hypothetical protein